MPVAATGAGSSGQNSEKRRRRLRVWVLLGLFIGTGIYWHYSPDRDVATAKAREFLAAARHNALVDRLGFLESWPKPFSTIPEHLRRKQDHRFETREQVEELGVTAIPLLTRALVKDPNAMIRPSIIRILAESRDDRVVPVLMDILAGDPQGSVRGAAAEALGHFGGTEAVIVLTKSMSADADFNVRSSAARSLGWIGDAQALPGLMDMLNWGRNPQLREAVINALGLIGDTQAFAPVMEMLVRKPDSPYLISFDSRVVTKLGQRRPAACGALGLLGDARAASPLIISLRNEDADVRAAAAWALGVLADSRAIPGLTRALKDPVPIVRFAATFALAQINDPRSVLALVANLAEPDRATQRDAAFALAIQGRTNGWSILEENLKSRKEWQRAVAVIALVHLQTPLAQERLKARLEDRSPEIRRLAARALAGEGAQAIADLPGGECRPYAAWSLAIFKDPRTLPALRRVCYDPDDQTRSAAQFAIRRIQHPADRQE